MNIISQLLSDAAKHKEFFNTCVEKAKSDLTGKDVVLYGAYTRGKKLYSIFKSNGIGIKYFCDDNASLHGCHIDGVEILSFEIALDILDKDAAFVIANYYFENLQKKLTSSGINNIYHYPELLVNVIEPDYIKGYEAEINDLYNMTADEKSKEVISNVLLHVLTGNVDILKNTKDEAHYFDSNIIKPISDEVFVDCGAYIGDTIEDFVEAYDNCFKHIYAFEADGKNFEQLKQNEKCVDERVTIINKGIFNTNGRLAFLSNGESSFVADNGSEFINTVTLDSYFLDNITFTPPPMGRSVPTYIKMDIEGAEMEALEGGRRIIQEYAPKLAICIYHKFEDLWNIPFYVKKLNPDYKIYIRHYALSQNDIVCYAVI